MTLQELMALASELSLEMTTMIDLADEANEDFDDDMTAEYEALEAKLSNTEGKIKRKKAMAERRAALPAITRTVSTVSEGIGQLAGTINAVSNQIIRPDGTEMPDQSAGFENLAEFALCVMNATQGGGSVNHDPRLAALYNINAADGSSPMRQQGGGNQEGYLVPPKMKDRLWELVLKEEGLINRTDHEPTSKNQVGYDKDETTAWSKDGVQARWRGEGDKMIASKMGGAQSFLTLDELYCFVIASEELLDDAPRLNNKLEKKSAQAINWKLDEAITRGTGVGQPQGFFNSDALITVSPEQGQAVKSILSRNIGNMYSRQLNPKQAIWLANNDIMPDLMELNKNGNLIFMPPASGVTGAPGGMLLGRPIEFSEHARSLGDKEDLSFIDFKGYWTLKRSVKAKFETSIHLFFDSNLQAFRWILRVAGQAHLSAPVKPNFGTNTKSHFVTLGERA